MGQAILLTKHEAAIKRAALFEQGTINELPTTVTNSRKCISL